MKTRPSPVLTVPSLQSHSTTLADVMSLGNDPCALSRCILSRSALWISLRRCRMKGCGHMHLQLSMLNLLQLQAAHCPEDLLKRHSGSVQCHAIHLRSRSTSIIQCGRLATHSDFVDLLTLDRSNLTHVNIPLITNDPVKRYNDTSSPLPMALLDCIGIQTGRGRLQLLTTILRDF